MTSPSWGITQGGGGFQNALATGLQFGQMTRQRQEERDTDNALAAYAANPDDPSAIPGLIKANPRLGLQVVQDQRAQRAQQQEGELVQRALAGDDDALTQLATVNFDKWKPLDAQQKAQAAEKAKIYANAALDVLQLPPEQRSQAIMGYANRFQSAEIAQIANLPPQEQEAALRSAVAEAQLTEKMIAMEQPKYMAIPAGGTLVDTRNPQAVQQFGQGPQPGMVEDGYRFKGGNPADPNAWEPVAAGGAGSGQQGFPQADY